MSIISAYTKGTLTVTSTSTPTLPLSYIYLNLYPYSCVYAHQPIHTINLTHTFLYPRPLHLFLPLPLPLCTYLNLYPCSSKFQPFVIQPPSLLTTDIILISVFISDPMEYNVMNCAFIMSDNQDDLRPSSRVVLMNTFMTDFL